MVASAITINTGSVLTADVFPRGRYCDCELPALSAIDPAGCKNRHALDEFIDSSIDHTQREEAMAAPAANRLRMST